MTNGLSVKRAQTVFPIENRSMTLLPLTLLQQAIHPEITGANWQRIKTSASPAMVYRVSISLSNGASAPATFVHKQILPDWPQDPNGADREVYFYSALAPQLDIRLPKVYLAGANPVTRERIIFLEALEDYRFPAENHRWTTQESECFLRTYARLHASANSNRLQNLDEDWLMARHETRLDPGELIHQAAELAERGLWRAHPVERLVDWVENRAKDIQQLPVTLLHNDVFPPNIGLPLDLCGDAVLVDWEMAGIGLPEMDLAFMFTQPYRSHAGLDRQKALEYYWEQRLALEGTIPPLQTRRVRQFYADAVWVLWLIPVAYRMARDPHSKGQAPYRYWTSFLAVLNEKLQALCGQLR